MPTIRRMAADSSGLVRGVYGSRLAAKLAGISLRQLRYWVSTGLLQPSVYKAGRGGRDLFSYTDLVQARVIGRLRKKGWTLPKIRRAIAYLQTTLPETESWHRQTLIADPSGLLTSLAPEEVVNTTHQSPGQKVFPIFLGDVVREIVSAGEALSIGRELEVNAAVQGGSPVIKGTRIPTRLIGDLLDEGVDAARITHLYPTVSPAAINAAKEFERQLAAV